MAKQEKPTPINREKFLKNLPDPYQIPEQDIQPYDTSNPNAIYRNSGEPPFIRGNEISVNGSDIKHINISLEDHDSSILFYLQNIIDTTVKINGDLKSIPVHYGSPERWKSMQKDGFFRDKNGKALIPVIAIKRESFEKNRTLGNKLDGNKVNNIQYFKEGWSKRNTYDNFSVLQNQKPSEEYRVGVIPDYITITYKLSIFTDFIEHMNKIIESIQFASDSYWGDKEKFLFRVFITQFPTSTSVEAGNDRAIRSDLSLTVHGYIIPDTINSYKSSPSPRFFNTTKLVLKEFIQETDFDVNLPKPTKKINIYDINDNKPLIYYGNFSGSFIGDGSGLINLPFPSSSIDTSSFVTYNIFNPFTSSYILDSSSFDERIISGAFVDAPIDGNQYGRQDGDWVLISSGIETISGDGVDNTDPLNPVITWPTPGDIGAESSLGFTPEDVSNKATDFTTINNTLYPSVQAVEDRIDLIPIVDDNVFLTHYPVGGIITLNNYIGSVINTAFGSNTTNANNITKFQSFVTNKAITIDALYLVQTNNNTGATATATLYVYDDSNDGLPGVKLHQEISATNIFNTTNKVITFRNNFTLQPGVYWFGIHIRNLDTLSTNPTFYFAPLGGNVKGYQTTAIAYTNNFQGVLGVAATVGDLTDNPTILTSLSTSLSVPMLKIKLG